MSIAFHSVITATGCYLPEIIVKNEDFLNRKFFKQNQVRIDKPNSEIISKFEEITGIKERRYVKPELHCSDIAYFAAKDALDSSGIDKETLDYIIVAHNFGDVSANNRRSDMVPSLAARVKQKLGINNPKTVAYDVIFGCPGWLQALIQADYFIRTGDCKRALIIGSETLSRIYDESDIDSMIYSDGAGAVIVEAVESSEPVGIISHASRSDALDYAGLLYMSESFNPEYENNDIFLKMYGHKLYKYALQNVPDLVKECLEKSGCSFFDIRKILIHQANGKMDEEILKRIFELYDIYNLPQEKIDSIMPMTISWLGNSSVATLPTLLDLMIKKKIEDQTIHSGDLIVLASVGAGMNINAVVYKAY